MARHSQPYGLYDLLQDLFNFRPGDALFFAACCTAGVLAMEDEATVCCLVNEQLVAI